MFIVDFLLKTIPSDDIVARDFVQYLVPNLFALYADTSAKGGDHHKSTIFDPTVQRKFEEKIDQTMVSHLLNGIFPMLHVFRILKEENIGLPFSDRAYRVYVLSYLMHDVDKIIAHNAVLQGAATVEEVATWDREHIEKAKTLIRKYLEQCEAHLFLPEYEEYLEDITYLVVNTQRQWNTHLHPYKWSFKLKKRSILPLRDCCMYSDIIAYFVPNPSAMYLSEETAKLRTILSTLSEDTLEFTYHQLRETRGLLTNTINTSMVHVMCDAYDGIWPYLFFADGVVYIKRRSLSLTLTTEKIFETIKLQLQQSCTNGILLNAPGFKFSIQGIAKHPDYYFEFLSIEAYMDLLRACVIQRTMKDTFSATWTKLRQLQEDGIIPGELTFEEQPDGHAASLMTRFLSVTFVTLLGLLDEGHTSLRTQVEQAVVEHLHFGEDWQKSTVIPIRGGVEYRWFWLAARFLHTHPGLSIEADENSLATVFASTFALILRLAGNALQAQLPKKYLQYLPPYIEHILEIQQGWQPSNDVSTFEQEIEQYEQSKAKKRMLLCTLCNSSYPTEEQSDSTVLFQPWVYKNKLSLYAGKNAGGICTLCSLELMLRQILLKNRLRLTGSKFEAQKAKYLTIYPDFFFTMETGSLINGMVDQLNNINFFAERKHLRQHQFTLKDLWKLDVFASPVKAVAQVIDLRGDEDDEDTEESDTVQEDKAPDSFYIKYQAQEYPGLVFFGMRAGRTDNDTASWAMPAFLALALSLVTSTKVVLSEMPYPLFATGRDFRETVVYDAPHPFLEYILQQKRIRVNNLLPTLRRLVSVYRVNIDTYAQQGNPSWGYLSRIARDLQTDPLYLFQYLRRQARIDSEHRSSISHYLALFEQIMEVPLGKSRIAECVNRYAIFYRGGYQSHSILKPIDIVARAIINSPLSIEKEDLLLQIRGEIKSWLDRVRSNNATGWACFRGKDISEKEQPAVRDFVYYFYEEVFQVYCEGERGLLRNRINRFKDGCEAYYLEHHASRKHQQSEEQPQLVEIE